MISTCYGKHDGLMMVGRYVFKLVPIFTIAIYYTVTLSYNRDIDSAKLLHSIYSTLHSVSPTVEGINVK